MQLKRVLGALALVGLVAPAALAASPKVGEEAPELGSTNWVMNAPQESSIKSLRGEVIFVEKWGVKCPPCVGLIPHVQQLQEQYSARGLHIFAFEAQNHSPEQIQQTIKSNGGKTYPVSAGGGNNFQGDGGIPVAWLIGVDGKVIWQGNPAAQRSQLDQLIESEVAKVRFPGLGKSDFDKDVLKAVKAYMGQQLGKAREEAQSVAADEKSSEAAKADAQFLIDKVNDLATRQWARVEACQQEGKHLEAYETLTWFSKTFQKSAEGDKASDQLKAYKKDKQLKKELSAAVALRSLLTKLEGQPAEVRQAALARFAEGKKSEGTAAAERAKSMK